ncbi:MAG TPA: hypothetical protein VIT68_05450 [Candidatus Gracilibacteria bacterium]
MTSVLNTLKQVSKSPLFWGGLVAKIVVAGLFSGQYLTHSFLPFLDSFVKNGFANPYNQFYTQNVTAFPYPTTMLWVMGVFYAPFAYMDVTFIKMIGVKLPLLLADLSILVSLLYFVPANSQKVVKLYWCSPILFYISYFYGQLDVIPTAILFGAILAMCHKRYFLAFLVLGIGVAAKSHLILAFPFFLGYTYIKKESFPRLWGYCGIFGLSVAALFMPYIGSVGFQQMVMQTSEAAKFFNLEASYNYNDLGVLILFAVSALAFFTFYSKNRISRDFFLLYLGMVFSLVVILAPPMAGWFYWSIPFLVYFYAKYKSAPRFAFWLLNIAYFAFFILQKDSDFFSSFYHLIPSISEFSVNPTFFNDYQSHIVQNLAFTTLVVSMLTTILWAYKMGIASNSEYRFQDIPFLIGIGGDSGAGKSTVVEDLLSQFHKDHALCINGDGAHKWERGHQNWQTQTHLNPTSNNLHTDLEHAIMLKKGQEIYRVEYDHHSGKFTNPQRVDTRKFIFFNGLHPFYLEKMRQVIDLKIFLDPHEDLRKHWKISRDMKERGYTKTKVLQQLEQRRKDSDKYIDPQKKFADVIIRFHPDRKIKNHGDPSEKFELKLGLEFDNSVNVDPFLEALHDLGGLEIEHDMSEDLSKQKCVFKGSIEGRKLHETIHKLMPNVEEISEQIGNFKDDLSGVLQLFMLYYIGQMLKFQNLK